MTKPISSGSEWSFALIAEYDAAIKAIAHNEFGLDTYPNQIEVITAEQMMDAYSSVGMPIGYHHWSFGKHFVNTENAYQRGQMGLAYEIVINSNPWRSAPSHGSARRAECGTLQGRSGRE